VHGTDINIGFAGYITDGANHPGSVKMVTEKEISLSGYNIRPKVIDLDDVELAISNCTRYCSGSYSGIGFQGKQVGVILTGRLFFFADLYATLCLYLMCVDFICPSIS